MNKGLSPRCGRGVAWWVRGHDRTGAPVLRVKAGRTGRRTRHVRSRSGVDSSDVDLCACSASLLVCSRQVETSDVAIK